MIFAQVIMICVSKYYISLIAESLKNIGVTWTSNILEKEVQGLKGGVQTYATLFREWEVYTRQQSQFMPFTRLFESWIIR